MNIDEVKNASELLQAVEVLKKRRLDARRPHEETWWNNLALLAGDHYAQWHPMKNTYVERMPENQDAVRLVLNQALVVARTEYAKITKSRPIMEVVPASESQEDLAAAKVGRFALDAAEWRFKLRKRRKSALWWMLGTGTSAMYVGWNPDDRSNGEISFIVDPTTQEAVFDPRRKEELRNMVSEGEIEALEEETYPLGDFDFKVYSSFQLLPDEVALEWSEINDLITVDIVDVGIARDLFNNRDITPDKPQPGVVQNRMIQRANMANVYAYMGNENTVAIYTYWLKPHVYRRNKFLQNGLMFRWCNGTHQLEFDKSFPFADQRIPFAFFTHIPSNTTIWGESILQHIRGPNIELDKRISQLLENANYMANPQWLVPIQSQIKGRGKIVNRPGNEIVYRALPNVPSPEPVSGMPMPAQIENLVVALRDQILDISGQGEVSRGRLPAAARSGIQVAYLQEEDETKIATTIENFEDGIAEMASLILERYSQFYTVERMLRVYREDGMFEVRKFKGADLKGNTDVVVQAGSALPRYKAARQQYVLELAQMGIETDPKRIRDMLELGQGEPDDVDKAYAQAERENKRMVATAMEKPEQLGATLMGEQPQQVSEAVPVKKWHNHEAHLKRHYAFMTDYEFERLAETHPDIVRLFDEHVTVHQQELLAIQQQALMMAMAARNGGPGGSGGPPSPPDVMSNEADLMSQMTPQP